MPSFLPLEGKHRQGLSPWEDSAVSALKALPFFFNWWWSVLSAGKGVLILFLTGHPLSVWRTARSQSNTEGNGYVKTLRNVLLITQAKREIK